MRRIVHLSDVHFGNNDASLIAPLRKRIESVQPHVVVVSGDFVEHATALEFRQARAFLDSLPKPQILVPGNHDLAFYNFFERAFSGLSRYRHYITDDLSPEYRDEEIAIVGANTSRKLQLRGGSLSSRQLGDLVKEFGEMPDQLTRILVTHHPFDLPQNQAQRLVVGHAHRSIKCLAPVLDVLLAGHIHLSSTGSTATHYKTDGHALAFVQAGTAISNRNKGEENSFNVLHTARTKSGDKAVVIDRYAWDKLQGIFDCTASSEYRLEKEGWAKYEGDSAVEIASFNPGLS